MCHYAIKLIICSLMEQLKQIHRLVFTLNIFIQVYKEVHIDCGMDIESIEFGMDFVCAFELEYSWIVDFSRIMVDDFWQYMFMYEL